MDFKECYTIVKDKFSHTDFSSVNNDFTCLVHFVDQCGGYVFLSYKDGMKVIVPENRSMADVTISLKIETFEKIINNSLDPVFAFTTGQIQAKGNVMRALSIYNSLR